MIRRLCATGWLIALAVLVQPTPAFAHGGGSTDATNFLSAITGVETAGPEGKPEGPATVPGLEWKVIAGDSMLEVENTTRSELRIPGYTGEPYLRIGPDGVRRNKNSPATYLNEGRFGGDVPAGVSENAEPKWVKVSDEPVFAWHEHRIHWMSQTLPPSVQADQGVERLVFDWAVPFELDDRQLVLTGQLKWIPPLQIWPWLLGALLVTSIPLAGVLLTKGSRRRSLVLKTGAAMVIVFAVLSVVHTIDDLMAVPASALENVFAAGRVIPFVVFALLGAIWALRDLRRSDIGLIFGAASISLGVGIAQVFALSNSQIATTLPEEFSRAVFAGTMMLFIPVGIAAWLSRLDFAERAADASTG